MKPTSKRPKVKAQVPPPGTRCWGERRPCSAIAVRIMQGRPLCAECVEIRRGSSPGPRPDCGLADKLELEAGNYLELDDGHSPPGCCLRVHDACEDIEEEPVDAYLPADAAGLRRIARWLSAWADELDARAREGR